MNLQKVVKKLQEEGTTPEEILKALKQRKYMLRKVNEYQKRTYRKVTVSARKERIKELKKKFPDVDEKILTKILCMQKIEKNILKAIPEDKFKQVWSEIRSEEKKALKSIINQKGSFRGKL